MKKIIALLSVLVFAVVLVYSLAFAVNNNQALSLDFLVGQSVSLPTSVWLGIFLVFGVLAGLLAGALVHARLKMRIHALTKKLKQQKTLNR